jgi:ABC transporter
MLIRVNWRSRSSEPGPALMSVGWVLMHSPYFVSKPHPCKTGVLRELPHPPVIEVRQVDKLFQTREGPFFALREVDLSVKSGEVFGIIGRSGAGKSTLLRVLNLLERPTAGEVLIEGRAITHLDGAELRRLRQQVGMVFQHFNLQAGQRQFPGVAQAGDGAAQPGREEIHPGQIPRVPLSRPSEEAETDCALMYQTAARA